MNSVLPRQIDVGIDSDVEEDAGGLAALGLAVLVVTVAEQVLVGAVSRQPVVGHVPRAAQLRLCLLFVGPDFQVVQTDGRAPVSTRLPEVVLVFPEVHLLHNGRQTVQTVKKECV